MSVDWTALLGCSRKDLCTWTLNVLTLSSFSVLTKNTPDAPVSEVLLQLSAAFTVDIQTFLFTSYCCFHQPLCICSLQSKVPCTLLLQNSVYYCCHTRRHIYHIYRLLKTQMSKDRIRILKHLFDSSLSPILYTFTPVTFFTLHLSYFHSAFWLLNS